MNHGRRSTASAFFNNLLEARRLQWELLKVENCGGYHTVRVLTANAGNEAVPLIGEEVMTAASDTRSTPRWFAALPPKSVGEIGHP
jgi:hypothetical protein